AVRQAPLVPLAEVRLEPSRARRLARLREECGQEVEARHPRPALRELDRMAARAARDIEDASAFSQVEDLVDRLDLGWGLRVDVPDQIVGPEEVLVPPLRDLRHRRAANVVNGENPSALTPGRSACRLCRPPRRPDA